MQVDAAYRGTRIGKDHTGPPVRQPMPRERFKGGIRGNGGKARRYLRTIQIPWPREHHGGGKEEAAEYLCVSKRTIYKLTKEGRLPAFRIGQERHRRFRKEDLDKVPRPSEEVETLERLTKLTAESDPVLAEIWDNENDAAYDRI